MSIPIEELKNCLKNPTAKEFSVFLVRVYNFLRGIPPWQVKSFLAKNQLNRNLSKFVSWKGPQIIITIEIAITTSNYRVLWIGGIGVAPIFLKCISGVC